VHAGHAATACWALQVVQPLQAEAQVHLAELVLAVCAAEGMHVDFSTWLQAEQWQIQEVSMTAHSAEPLLADKQHLPVIPLWGAVWQPRLQWPSGSHSRRW
jgi:hypothetical protein